MSFRETLKKLVGHRGQLLARRLGITRFRITRHYRSRLRALEALEIGGPTDLFGNLGQFPLYSSFESVDNCNYAAQTLWNSDAVTFRRTLIGEGTKLPVDDESYDCLVASHCLEHIANPVKALVEWKRVIRPRGFLLLILPHRDLTFDWRRPITTVEHLREDFRNDTPETDLSHLDEILALHDLSRDPAAGTPEQFKERCLKNAQFRAIHHHVFAPETAAELMGEVGFSIVRQDVQESHIITLGSKSP
jgi:SAM-dependent methyltransferase